MIKYDNTVMTVDDDETRDPRTPGVTEDGVIGQQAEPPTMMTLHHHRCHLEAVLAGREDAVYPSYQEEDVSEDGTYLI
uniref:Uncharacterized protein n=1 Tax=Oryza meridionalis TaxID=40149 RepID=A0A0E0FAB8_9ORYZ